MTTRESIAINCRCDQISKAIDAALTERTKACAVAAESILVGHGFSQAVKHPSGAAADCVRAILALDKPADRRPFGCDCWAFEDDYWRATPCLVVLAQDNFCRFCGKARQVPA
jgi:hypothetical protein